MYLAYMDECGNTGIKADPDQPIHFLGCLVVEDTRVRDFETALRGIAKEFFPKHWKNPSFEFHGNELFAGSGFFKCDPQKRIDATQALIEAANSHCATFGYVGVDKLKSVASDHPHRICFTLLMERLQSWLLARDSLALLVSDENHEVEQEIIRDLENFKQKSTTWGYKSTPITNVIDSVHFVKSKNNLIIQAADVLTYISLKAIQIKREKWSAFRKRSDQKKKWVEWADENCDRSQIATRKLCNAIELVAFRSKIWP